jgi:hypothetical protein
MADTPDATLPTIPQSQRFGEIASGVAPTIYFEDVPVYGHFQNILKLTLTDTRLISTVPGDVTNEQVFVAHLRMSFGTAVALRNVLDKALLFATPVSSEAKN